MNSELDFYFVINLIREWYKHCLDSQRAYEIRHCFFSMCTMVGVSARCTTHANKQPSAYFHFFFSIGTILLLFWCLNTVFFCLVSVNFMRLGYLIICNFGFTSATFMRSFSISLPFSAPLLCFYVLYCTPNVLMAYPHSSYGASLGTLQLSSRRFFHILRFSSPFLFIYCIFVKVSDTVDDTSNFIYFFIWRDFILIMFLFGSKL